MLPTRREITREHEAEQELSGLSGDHATYLSSGPYPGTCDAESATQPLLDSPALVGGESYEFAAIANLDLFFTRVYRYWHERGLRSILLSGALNLLALGFTAAFSAFLLLFVDWRALHAECIAPRTGGGSGGGAGGADADAGGGAAASRGCDLAAVGLDRRPLLGRGLGAELLALTYLAVCASYLAWTALHYMADVRDMREVAHFMANKLGIGEGKVVTMTWAEVAHRLVLVQRTTRLCIAADLDELGIVARIMRKENYLIAMINRNVLHLHLKPPPDLPPPLRLLAGAGLRLLAALGGGGGGSGGGGGGRCCPPLLTKTLEWNLRWAILDHMFDERFRIRPDFYDVAALKRRLRLVAAANLLLSPCLLLFLLAHFLCLNAERLYRHPAALGSRRWSGLARWTIRELNELPHYLQHRLSASHPAALRYCAQFPSHNLAAVAKFLVFVTGSFVAALLVMTFLDESLLERPLLGRQVVWWLGTMTVVLATCRTLVSEEPVAYDPERALADVVSYTHQLPRHWRGRAHTPEVQSAFLSLFRLKVALFAEELLGLITTPLLLACAMPACADSIVEFVSSFTTHAEGLGDVCSLAAFDSALARHGNAKYGAPHHADKALRSRQGKLEKSFLTFVATYPSWEPGKVGRTMLAALAGNGGGTGGAGGGGAAGSPGGAGAPAGGGLATDGLPFHQGPPTAFPYQAAAAAGTGGKATGAEEATAAAALTCAPSAGSARWAAGNAGAGEEVAAADGGAAGPPRGLPPRWPGPHPPPATGPYLRRPPQPPLHSLPHHGVRSYTSNATGSHISAPGRGGGGAGGGGGGGWAPTGPINGGAVGASPSVASSQFSNLAAPYMQYYPVPLFYAHQQHQQAARHAHRQHQRRAYEQLSYADGGAHGGGGGYMPHLAAPSQYGRRGAASSIAADGSAWYGDGQQSLGPSPYDMYGHLQFPSVLHSHPLPHASEPGMLGVPPPVATGCALNGGLGPFSAMAPGHVLGSGRPPLPPSSVPAAKAGLQAGQRRSGEFFPVAGVAAAAAASRMSPSAASPPSAAVPSPGVGRCGAIVGDGSGCAASTEATVAAAELAVAHARDGGSEAQPAAQPCGPGPGSGSFVVVTGAGAGQSPRAVAGAGPGRQPDDGDNQSNTAGDDSGGDAAGCPAATAASGDGSGSGSGVGVSSGVAGTGCGSDILDMRGLEELAPAAAACAAAGPPQGHDQDYDDDPLGLGGFVELPAAAPPQPAAPLLPSGMFEGIPLEEDPDGFGLVPAAAGGAETVDNVRSAPRVCAVTHAPQPPSPSLRACGLSQALPQQQSQQQPQQQPQQALQRPPQPHQYPHASQQGAQSAIGDPASSQMYYCTDYYAAEGSYFGLDEYGMYDYDAELYAGGRGLVPVLEHGAEAAALGGHAGSVGLAAAAAHAPRREPSVGGGWRVARELEGAASPGRHSTQHRHLPRRDTPAQRHSQDSRRSPRPIGDVAPIAGEALRASIFGVAGDAAPPPAPAAAAPGGVLPTNETSELLGRLTAGHSLLHSHYEASDATVQHRRQQQRHARAVLAAAAPPAGPDGDVGADHRYHSAGGDAGSSRDGWASSSGGFGWALPSAEV